MNIFGARCISLAHND